MTDGPIVSVIIPAYNGAAWIGETLASLDAQTLTDWEAIVVDDRSSDATRALIRDWPDARVRLVENPENVGPVRTRNRGVAEARGRYIAGLDQDDVCRPERLARQVAYLDANPAVALVGTQAEQLRDGRVSAMQYARATTPALVAWLAWIENPLVWSSVMMRGDVVRALTPFTRPEILYAEDFDLYHRVGAFGAIARLDTPLLLYRQHAGGASKRFTETMRTSATRVLAERHAGVLGADAAEVARLLVLHNMGGVPVPDGATLRRLREGVARLQAAYLARTRVSQEDERLIRFETARRLAELARVGLRAGTVGLREARADRALGLGAAVMAAGVGRVRVVLGSRR